MKRNNSRTTLANKNTRANIPKTIPKGKSVTSLSGIALVQSTNNNNTNTNTNNNIKTITNNNNNINNNTTTNRASLATSISISDFMNQTSTNNMPMEYDTNNDMNNTMDLMLAGGEEEEEVEERDQPLLTVPVVAHTGPEMHSKQDNDDIFRSVHPSMYSLPINNNTTTTYSANTNTTNNSYGNSGRSNAIQESEVTVEGSVPAVVEEDDWGFDNSNSNSNDAPSTNTTTNMNIDTAITNTIAINNTNSTSTNDLLKLRDQEKRNREAKEETYIPSLHASKAYFDIMEDD